jgi:hypothetical protein
MASTTLLAEQAARGDFEARIATVTAASFLTGRIAPVLPDRGCGTVCRATVVGNDGTASATVALEYETGFRAVARFYRDDAGERCYRVLTALWRGGFGPGNQYRVAQPLGFFPEVNMVLARAAPGIPLASAATDEQLGAGAVEAARWLARLHASPLRIGSPRYPWDVYHELLHRLARASVAHAAHADLLLALADRLEGAARHMRLQLVQAHGQFWHTRVFIAPECVSGIDLDRSRPGDPARDVGDYIHYMRSTHWAATGGGSRAEAATHAFLREYTQQNSWATGYLGNLPFYWGLNALVSLSRFMAAGTAGTPEWDRTQEFYLSEFDRAVSFCPTAWQPAGP